MTSSKRRLNICLISNDFPPNIVGGVGVYTERLAVGLAERGHNITVIASAHKPKRKYPKNIQLFLTLKRNLLSFWGFCHQTFKYKIKNKADIIHGNDIFHLPICLQKPPQIKIITTVHNSYLQRFTHYAPYRKLYYPLLIFLEQLAFLNSDRIITVSDSSRNYVNKYLGTNKKIEMIPNGVNTGIFLSSPTDYLKSKLKLKKGNKIILFVGRLVENKRPLFLIELAKGHFPPNWHLVLVGEGPQKEKIQEEASERNNIHYIGKVDYNQMPKIYNSSDLFILPSKGEGLSLTLLEALSCGLPAIITPQVNFRNLVEGGVNGFCLKLSEEAQLWIGTIKKCLEQKQKFGKVSRKKIIQNGLTEEGFIKRHEELYYETLKS